MTRPIRRKSQLTRPPQVYSKTMTHSETNIFPINAIGAGSLVPGPLGQVAAGARYSVAC